tara:strand:- start:156 stop:1031 length:876 start_codon:yes stop_codon:yes gene_type:complete
LIKTYDLIQQFELKLVGEFTNTTISSVNSIHNQNECGLSWIKDESILKNVKKGIYIVSDKITLPKKKDVVFLLTSKSPKVIFSKILNQYFAKPINYYLVNEVSKHKANHEIIVSDNVFIGQNVKIGKGTIIFPNVVIEADSVVGENCIIKSHVSIGTDGLGFEHEDQKLVKFPQLGNVIIGNNVELGPNSTVRRATLDSTVIGEGSKIGSLVNIGHNSLIGQNCILTCNVITGGSSILGKDVFMGINSIIKNGVSIGDNSKIGMGSVVIKDIPSNVVAFGNPAKKISHRKN